MVDGMEINWKHMKVMNVLVLLILICLSGCLQRPSNDELSATESYCTVSGKEIQEICGVTLERINFIKYQTWDNETYAFLNESSENCNYIISSDGTILKEGITFSTYKNYNVTLDSIKQNMRVPYETVDNLNGGIYVQSENEGIPRYELIFQKDDKMYYLIMDIKPGLLGKGSCESKDGTIKLAKLFINQTNY